MKTLKETFKTKYIEKKLKNIKLSKKSEINKNDESYHNNSKAKGHLLSSKFQRPNIFLMAFLLSTGFSGGFLLIGLGLIMSPPYCQFEFLQCPCIYHSFPKARHVFLCQQSLRCQSLKSHLHP